MNRRRTINGDSERAYRVVWEGYGYTRYYGPYSTLSAAKGKRTTELKESQHYGDNAAKVWIEQTPEGWERVED